MSRYYDIAVTPAPTKGNASPAVYRRWTSHPAGRYDPGALNVEFDFLSYAYATPMGASSLTIEGIALADLLQGQQFAGMQVSIKAGMQAGLPLADPRQSGLILQGMLFQSFGNWRGTDMTLDFVIYASPYTYAAPGNIVLNWRAGTTLSDALAATFRLAYPNLTASIDISPNIVLSYDDVAHYHTLEQLAHHIKSITKGTVSNNYPGVDITMQGGKILAFDGTGSPAIVLLKFTDLIGQPTWVDVNTMQVMCVMRADVQVGMTVVMPQGLQDAPGIVQTTAASYPSQLKYKTSFQGKFTVISVRQVGNYRSGNGADWSTILQCVVAGNG